MQQPLRKKPHESINSSKAKKIWKLFKIRDIDNEGELICTLCQQGVHYDDTKDYQLTIGHINYPSPEHENLFNSNDEVNLTPQHSRCNNLLQGKAYYKQHMPQLLEILKKNIEFSKSHQRTKLEFSRDNSVLEDSSTIQNEKSKGYDAKCEQYLSTYLIEVTTRIPFSVARDDIVGLCYDAFGFGNTVTVARHLKEACNRFRLRYVLEADEDSIDVIRLMRREEKEKYQAQLDLFKNESDKSST